MDPLTPAVRRRASNRFVQQEVLVEDRPMSSGNSGRSTMRRRGSERACSSSSRSAIAAGLVTRGELGGAVLDEFLDDPAA